MNPNPWDALIPYIEAMDAAALKRLGEFMTRPIVDPPFHGEIGDCWSEPEEEQ